jgi:lipopolysaccharide transport system ATP-binding protein
MSDIAIKVENVSKLYTLGMLGTGTIAKDFERWFARIRGKEDPFFQIGQVNDRTVKSKTNVVWALRDISFEVKKGEIMGIIGRNGAGKSTMLKILCKITAPTKGRIYIDGRIGSLLEVGTGFHPEMTGRENVFMNGAILGMSKETIRAKFDEIVDFAGVEAYIDTPVKHYSSGMYTRLAFSSAAFLEPEILILDEVLAVGDMEFSRKCMDRMREVNLKEGRTVILVSHNMANIKNLTRKCLYFEKGTLIGEGDPEELTATYETNMTSLTG